jgi:hypothetical protein
MIMKKRHRQAQHDAALNAAADNEIANSHLHKAESDAKLYKFGFWLFFFLVIFSVTFSVWAISSIYTNFRTVTKILDESFERTNLVLDITSSKISSCEQQVKDCQVTTGRNGSPAPAG